IVNLGNDDILRWSCHADKFCVEADGPAAADGASRQDGLQESLRKVHVLAWTCSLVRALGPSVSGMVFHVVFPLWTLVIPCARDGDPTSTRGRTPRQP